MKRILLIINVKTLIITLLAILSTWLCITWDIKAEYPLTLIATAVIFPIVFSINGAYKRRETALSHYGSLKSHCHALFLVARDWLDNPSPASLDNARAQTLALLSACRNFFTGTFAQGRQNEAQVYLAFSNLSRFIKEDLRGQGLPSGEVSRCNQYLSKMLIAFEEAKHIYQYRTPRTLRTFSSVFISLVPILYGPYFAHQAAEYSPHVTYVMPVLFSLVLVSLSNIQDHLENPFDGIGEDDITINVEHFAKRLLD